MGGTWNSGSQIGNGGGCEEMRKWMIDLCCLQVRWRGKGARMLGMKGRRHKPWWTGKGNGVVGVGDMAEGLCKKVVEVRKVILVR